MKLHPDADRTLDTEGVAVQIPAGTVIQLDGIAELSGLRNVIWQSEFYALFERDLLANAEAE